jgi:hypothetical protein
MVTAAVSDCKVKSVTLLHELHAGLVLPGDSSGLAKHRP